MQPARPLRMPDAGGEREPAPQVPPAPLSLLAATLGLTFSLAQLERNERRRARSHLRYEPRIGGGAGAAETSSVRPFPTRRPNVAVRPRPSRVSGWTGAIVAAIAGPASKFAGFRKAMRRLARKSPEHPCGARPGDLEACLSWPVRVPGSKVGRSLPPTWRRGGTSRAGSRAPRPARSAIDISERDRRQ